MQTPLWHALAAEFGTAASQLGAGATALGNTRPERPWSYYTAFFPLSIGMERVAKLVLQVDSVLTSGSYLTTKQMRASRHDLDDLFDAVDAVVARRYPARKELARPADPVHRAIQHVLSGFAINGRYRHLDHIGGKEGLSDAAEEWSRTVVEVLAARHYSATARRRDEQQAIVTQALLSGAYIGRQTLVDGSAHSEVASVVKIGKLHEAMVKWARMYTMQSVRWLVRVLVAMGDEPGSRAIELPDVGDFFYWLNQPDERYRSKVTWVMPGPR